MSRALQLLAVSAGAAVLVLSGAAVASAKPSTSPVAYTCTGGDFQTGTFVPIPSGTYASITVTGACDVPDNAVINVVGDVHVGPNAVLDAQSAPSTDKAVQSITASSQSPDCVSSPVCPGPKCPDILKPAIKVKLDPPPIPDQSHPDPDHSTAGPAVNPGH